MCFYCYQGRASDTGKDATVPGAYHHSNDRNSSAVPSVSTLSFSTDSGCSGGNKLNKTGVSSTVVAGVMEGRNPSCSVISPITVQSRSSGDTFVSM